MYPLDLSPHHVSPSPYFSLSLSSSYAPLKLVPPPPPYVATNFGQMQQILRKRKYEKEASCSFKLSWLALLTTETQISWQFQGFKQL